MAFGDKRLANGRKGVRYHLNWRTISADRLDFNTRKLQERHLTPLFRHDHDARNVSMLQRVEPRSFTWLTNGGEDVGTNSRRTLLGFITIWPVPKYAKKGSRQAHRGKDEKPQNEADFRKHAVQVK